jgi:hypothetical protein
MMDFLRPLPFGPGITPAAPSTPAGVYADRQTQAAYEAWCAGAASASKEIMRSMVAGFSPEELASRGIV